MYAVYVNLLSGTTGRCDGDVISKRGLLSYDVRHGSKAEISAFRTWRRSRCRLTVGLENLRKVQVVPMRSATRD